MRILPASMLLLATVSLLTEPTDSAVHQFAALQSKLQAAHAAQDWPAYLSAAKQEKLFLNEDPDSLLQVALAEIHLSDFNAALRDLNQFATMGQSADLPARSSDFAALLGKPEYAELQSTMAANRKPISLASTAMQLPDANLLPEDIDYDPGTHRFLITSVREKKILAIDAAGTSIDFAKSPDNWPMMAIKIDPAHDLLWATEVALQGFTFVSKPDWGRSALLCYDLRTGKLLHRVEGPKASALGDMALTLNGDVIVSDGDGGGVYRMAVGADALERVDNGDFLSPQTPALHPDGQRIFVPDYERGIGILDLSTRRVHWLATQGRFALNGIDGLYFNHGKLIAIQNGTSPERVIVFTLNPALSSVISETVIERSTSTLGDPTHGVVVGDDFYYIANSGWDLLDDQGKIKPGAALSRARLMRIRTTL